LPIEENENKKVVMPHKQQIKWYSMSAKGKTADISIYEQIGSSFFEDGVTAKSFEKDLRALGDVTQINLSMNSPGGSVFEGVSIYNMLSAHKAKVVVTINGLAASIASVIAMAGDEIIMPENSMMMIHNPWSVSVGDANKMRKEADTMDKIKESIMTTYESRTGQSRQKITDMMDEETWMTAQEAKDLGFADSVSKPVKMAAMFQNLGDYRNTPWAQLAAKSHLTPISMMKEESIKMPEPAAKTEPVIQMSQEQFDEAIAKAVKANVGPELQRLNEMRAKQTSEKLFSFVQNGHITPAQCKLMDSLASQLMASQETLNWSLNEDGSDKRSGSPIDALMALASTMKHDLLSEAIDAQDVTINPARPSSAQKPKPKKPCSWEPDMSAMEERFEGCPDAYVMDQYIQKVLAPEHPQAKYAELVAMAQKDEALREILKQYS